MSFAQARKIIFYISILACVFACRKKSKSPQLQPFNKDGNAQVACEQLNIARDASWTSAFLKNFLTCVASSEEKFQMTLDLMESLGDQGLQAGLDLLRWNPSADLQKDPLLGSLSVLMDRGTRKDDGSELVDSDARWNATQGFLENMRPYAAAKLLLKLQEKGLLKDFWSLMATLDKDLPQGFHGVMLRQLLTDPQSQADLRTIIDVLVKNPEAYEELKIFVKAESYRFTDPCENAGACFFPASEQSRTTAQHWLSFWNSLGAERQDRLQKMLSQVLQVSLEQDDALALDRNQQLFDLAEDSLLRTKNLYLQFAEIFHVVRNTSLESFAPFIEGMARVKDNPLYLDAFQEKTGSTYLQDLVQDFLWKGGQPNSCAIRFAGLKDAKDSGAFQATYKSLVNPSANCGGQVPVLLFMSQSIGWECPRDLCSAPMLPDANADMAPLVQYALKTLEEKLKADPWYLYQKAAARDEISAEAFAVLKPIIDKAAKSSTAELLDLEAQAARDPRLKKVLAPDWLERWLTQELLELSSIEDSFQGLFPDRDPIEQWYYSDADTRMSRVLYGLYEAGPGARAQQEIFSFESAKSAWFRFKPNSKASDRDIAQIIAALRSIHAQAKNPLAAFKGEAEKISLPWVGSLRNTPRFAGDGKREVDAASLNPSLLLDEGADGLAIRSRFKDQMLLASAALPKDESDLFQDWLFSKYIPAQIAAFKAQNNAAAELPFELFDRDALRPVDARFMALFLAQQADANQQAFPEGAQLNSQPAQNQGAKNQAARQLSGPATFGGSDWTSLWAYDSGFAGEDKKSLRGLIDAVDSDENRLKTLLEGRVSNPPVLKQGQLNPADAAKLDAHERLLLQLHLTAPIFQSRGQQYFVPAIGFGAQCPQKTENEGWKAVACPFHYESFTAYRQEIQARIRGSFCAVLGLDGRIDANLAKQMGFQDSAADLNKICEGEAASWTFPQTWLSQVLRDSLQLGRNPKLKAAFKNLPVTLRLAKAIKMNDPKQAFAQFLNHSPILSGGTSARILQRVGTYQALTQESPKLISGWLLYLNERIANRDISAALKKLGSQPLPGSQMPVQDLLGLVTASYEKAKTQKMTTLEYIFDLTSALSAQPYARETLYRLFAKPYDPYVGILLGYTLPQAIKAGILSDFNWNTYAPLRLMIQPANLIDGQRMMSIFDRDAIGWFDTWERIRKPFPTAKAMGEDADLLVHFLENYFERAELALGKSQAFMRLARSLNLAPAIPALVRLNRVLNKSVADLDNVYQKPYVGQMDQLAGVIVKAGPMAWQLMDQLTLDDEARDLGMEALVGLMRAPLKQDGKEIFALLQDARVGMRSPSLWSFAWSSEEWQKNAETLLSAANKTEKSQWQNVQKEWMQTGPNLGRQLKYMAENIVWKNPNAQSQKAALKTLSLTVNSPERWAQTQKIFEAWIDDGSAIRAWREDK